MGEVDFNEREDDYNVKIVDAGEFKEPGGGMKKPSQEEIDAYKIHRIVVMILFGIVVVVLLLIVVIMIATVDRCEPEPEQLPWWKSGVVYNIYPRTFKDSNDDGVGDFKGIIKKLDYIKDLGVNILYLSSVFKIDKNVDYGYAVVDFDETNTEYGTVEDFKLLVDAAHEKGLKVIIEFVPNETSEKHKWFQTSRSNDTNAKRDWYIWNDNNATDKWQKDNQRGKYYLRQKGGKADLNWNNDDVQKELQRVLGIWLDRGVDGFRVVSVAKLFDTPSANDISKIHLILNKWHNYTTKKSPNSILIGASHNADPSYYGTEKHPELDIVVNFRLVPENNKARSFYTAQNFKTIIDDYLGKVPKGKWPSWALTSWVHKRVGSNVSPELARSLNVLLLTLPGTPIVFNGDEIGMTGNNNSSMQWENETNADIKVFKNVMKLREADNLTLLNRNLSLFSTDVLSGSVLVYRFKYKSSFLMVINFDKDKSKTIDLSKLKVTDIELKLFTSDKKPEQKDIKKIDVPAMALFVYKVALDV